MRRNSKSVKVSRHQSVGGQAKCPAIKALAGRQSVSVINLNRRYKLNNAFIKKIIRDILRYIKKPHDVELEVVFLDDRYIRRLNKRYMARDLPTDVLSFRLARAEFGRQSDLGEIFISLDRAFENSKAFDSRFGHEVTLYVIHGILHLFGYTDKTAGDRSRMSKKESGILRYLCTKEDLSKVLTRR